MEKTKAAERARLATAAMVFGVVAPIAYVVQRSIEIARATAPMDPLLVLRDAHTAFYWRAASATWWGGLVAIAVFALCKYAPRATLVSQKLLTWITVPIALAIIVIAWAFP